MSKLFNKYVIAVIGFYIFWLGLLPLILSSTVTLLCQNISHNTDYKITVENPRVRLYFTPVLKFKANSILCENKNLKTDLKVENFTVKVRLLPLLSGKVHINRLSMDNFILKNELNGKHKLSGSFFKKLKKTRAVVDCVNLKAFGVILLSDANQTPIVYEGKNFEFFKKNKSFGLSVDSYLKSQNNSSEIFINLFMPRNNDIGKVKFDALVSNLDIAPFGEFFRNYLSDEIDNLQGKLNIKADKNSLSAEFQGLKVIYKDKDYSIIFPENTSVNSGFQIGNDAISINSFEFKGGNIDLSLSGKIMDYLGKTIPSTDLKLIINKSRTEAFVDILPLFKVDDLDGYKLKKYRFYGDVIGNLSIQGKLPEPNVYGKLYIDNGILIKPIPNTTKGATIKLFFTGKHVNYKVGVPAGGNQKVFVDGVQELYNIKYAELTVKSTENVSLHSAEEVVNPLHEIFNFVIGPVPILDVYGTGNIDLTVKGTREVPHAWGRLNFYNADVNFIEIPDLKLNNAEAVLNFNDTNASFKTTKGTVNGKDFKISGTCNLEGKFDFDVSSENQPISNLYHAIQTSTMIEDVKKMVPKVDKISGLADLNLKIYGTLKKIEDLKFNKNAFAKGIIKLKDNEISVQGITLNKANIEIKADGTSANSIINAYLSDLPLNIVANIKGNIVDLTAKIPKLNLNTLIEDRSIREQNLLPFASIDAKYKGNIENIEYNKIDLDSAIIYQKTNNLFDFRSGKVSLHGGKLTIKNFNLDIIKPDNNIKADLQISNAFTKSPVTNGLLKVKVSDIKVLNDILNKRLLPPKINNELLNYEFENGSINFIARFNDGQISTESDLSGIGFKYAPFELPVKILNGKMIVSNNDLYFKAINMLADNMPILIDGDIRDIATKQKFNIYLSSKPEQEFIDKFLNKHMIYPLKIKGDIICNSTIKGTPTNYDILAKILLAKDSSIYYYGATIGDVENAIGLSLDAKIQNQKELKIKEFLYNKLINSQNGKQTKLNMLRVKGGMNVLNDGVEFKDLSIKTSYPTDIRVLNIMFGKPNIKQGQFTSDLRLYGKSSNPKILGIFNIMETNIPFLDTMMKNIEFVFKDKYIDISSNGEVFGNDVSVKATLVNKLTKPYYIEKALITTNDMDLNRIISKLKSVEADNEKPQDSFGNFDITSIIANNLKFKADKIALRNIRATNFEAETSLNKDKIFEMKNFKLDIAKGNLNGSYKYDIGNKDVYLNMEAQNISANDITLAVFDLQNQIYGDLTGKIELSCDGDSFEKCMQTLNGNTLFNVKDGKMPKLGSLEYLLKAGNLVKGGITGLSINSVIDLITPMKTGEFSDIFGSIFIKDGIAENIEITTQGEDLSLFIGGKYNFATSIADMEVLGLLSRKISTMFGPIGNLSVNTLFNLIPGVDLSKDSNVLQNINKIPGIELSDKSYRKFLAIIKGNINGDDYVTSFKWIN